MTDFTRENTTRLTALLKQETALFEQIREMTAEQKELLDNDDIVGFDKSLDSRQELIEKINGLHQETTLLMQSYLSSTASGKKNAAIEEADKKRRNAIAECAATNDENIAATKDKMGDYTRQISKLSMSRKTIGAYALGVPNNPERFDKTT